MNTNFVDSSGTDLRESLIVTKPRNPRDQALDPPTGLM